jgi:hypothetical protein
MAKRKEAEQFILKYLDKILPKGYSVKLYKDMFAQMTDVEFEQYMSDLESGKQHLVLYAPNMQETQLNTKRNIEIAKELGHDFFQRLWIGKNNDTPTYLTPIKYMVVDMPVRRASQLLTKKIKIPEHNKSVDILTGQPTAKSKGSRVSFEEMKILAAMGLDNCIVEMMKFRGGDLKGFNAMNAMISRYGTANLKTLNNFASGVESTKTFSTYLRAMHFKTNL